ncbi:MAG: hypothetical protein VYE77_11715 [Planctomycetota bacterium]|nr:hypothetical protein [Planctomycetota bacterium]
MSTPSPAPSHHNPRMHQGGKLSFRARLKDKDQALDPGDHLVHGGEDPPPITELVPDGFDEVAVEIGPGKGAFLLAATAARPDRFVLGIEAAPGYASYAAAKLSARERDNGLVLIDNGKLYLQDRVPEGSLDAIHVYYPDPWPKRRHQNRRFFTRDVPEILARALRPDGHVFIATDNSAYSGQICVVMGCSPLFVRDDEAAAQALEDGPGHAFTPTNFERKYIEQGRVLRHYAFRKADCS